MPGSGTCLSRGDRQDAHQRCRKKSRGRRITLWCWWISLGWTSRVGAIERPGSAARRMLSRVTACRAVL